jgi:iron only hydrogenase large subunit-like protein
LRGNKGIKETSIRIGKKTWEFLVVSGLSNAVPVLEGIRKGKCKYDWIEIMACAGGCVNGGGQPVGADEKAVRARIKSLYAIDEKEIIRFAHKNPRVNELFLDYLGETVSDKSVSILHTGYSGRKVLI